MNYLNAGGRLYIENADLGYYHSSTELYQMLGCSYLGDGNPYTTGNVQGVNGESGTFVQGMGFDYLYQQPPDNYIDMINGVAGGVVIFRSQDNVGRVVANDVTDAYRSIHSTVMFGPLRNGSDTKLALMSAYMDFFFGPVGAEEKTSEIISHAILAPNPAHGAVALEFALADPARVEVNVYNTAGRQIRTLVRTCMPQGSHRVIWDGKDDSGQEVSCGTYLFTLALNEIVISKTVVLLK